MVDALAAVRSIAGSLILVSVDYRAVRRALALPGNDFEDNLQIACAEIASLDLIVTRDPDGFRDSPVPAHSPAEVLALIGMPQTNDPR